MKVTRGLGRVFKPFVNFPRWMGLRQISANAAGIVRMIKDLRIHRPEVRQESFEEAMERMNLTEEIIKERMKTCLFLSLTYTFAAICFFAYTLYMIFHGHLGMIMGALVTTLMAVFAYRESFWYFQMKTRTLGNSFKDWVSFILRRGARK